MSNVLNQLGIKQNKPNLPELLYYFMKEFGFNPLDEEWIVDGKKMTKKGISIPLFNALIEQMTKHYQRETQVARRKW